MTVATSAGTTQRSGADAIELVGKEVAFGSHQVIRGVTVRIPRSAMVGLIGPSGSGKSVLLKSLLGVLDSPEIVERGVGIVHGRASLMFQEGALFDSLTVFDNLAFPLVHGRVPARNLPDSIREEVRSQVSGALARVGLLKAAWKYPAQLSGGMRRRVSLARALIAHPEVALLDDPTAGLDPVASSVIMELIRELHEEQSLTTVIVSHDLRRLLPSVDSVIALEHGQVVFQGSLTELLSGAPDSIRHFVHCRFDASKYQDRTSRTVP